MNTKRIPLIIGSILALPLVSAAPLDVIQSAMNKIMVGLQTPEIVYTLTLLLFFIMFYAIYAAAARRVSVFQENNTLSKQGKILAVALSAITNLGIFYYTKDVGVAQALENLLSPFGVFGGLGLAGIMFLLVWRGFNDDIGNSKAAQAGLFFAGLMMVAFGTWLSRPNIMSLGWLIAFIALLVVAIGALFGGFLSGDDSGNGNNPPGTPTPGTPTGGRQRAPRPSNVANFNAVHNGNDMDLIWSPNPANENVAHYEIQRRPVIGSYLRGNIPLVGNYMPLLGGWRTVVERANPAPDGAGMLNFNDNRTFRWPLNTPNNTITPGNQFQYRIRAINNAGNSGSWTYATSANATPPPPPPPPIAPPTYAVGPGFGNNIVVTLTPAPGTAVTIGTPGTINVIFTDTAGTNYPQAVNIEAHTGGALAYTFWFPHPVSGVVDGSQPVQLIVTLPGALVLANVANIAIDVTAVNVT